MVIKKIITSKYFGKVRTVQDTENETIIFCAIDVAKSLGFSDPGKSVRNICFNLVKEVHYTDGGLQVLNFIDIKDIERLFVHCKKSTQNFFFLQCLYEISKDFSVYMEALKKEDVKTKGSLSKYCCGDCHICPFENICNDFCDGNCEKCKHFSECNYTEENYSDTYEYTHCPEYLNLVKRKTMKNGEGMIYKSYAIKLDDFINEIVNAKGNI